MFDIEDFVLKNAKENPFRTIEEIAKMNDVSRKECAVILKKDDFNLTKERKKIVEQLYEIKKGEIELKDKASKTTGILETLKEFPYIPREILAKYYDCKKSYVSSCIRVKGYNLREMRRDNFDDYYQLLENQEKAV